VIDFIVRLLNMYSAKFRTVLSHRMCISLNGLLVVASDEICI